jgi:hypothetical protein
MANSGLRWDIQEDRQLTNLFNKYHMEIKDIANVHMRSCESIRLRLIKLDLIKEESNTLKNNNFIWEMAIEHEKLQKEKGINYPNRFQFFSEVISKAITQNDICNKQIITNLEKRILLLEQNQLNSLD